MRLNNIDAKIITYFTANDENNICGNLIELWERDCKKAEERSIKIFHGKEEWYLKNASSGFRNAAQSLRQEKKSQVSRTPKIIGKIKTGTINRESRKTMITVLEVEVTTNITHVNLEQTNPIKMTKKNGLH